MVGFIGALSSSLCILILVFITLLIGYIDSLLPEASLFRINESSYRYPIASYFVTDSIEGEVDAVLTKLAEDHRFVPDELLVGCTSGFDIQPEMAENIMVFNTIKLGAFTLPMQSRMADNSELVDNKLNYCYLEFKRVGDG